MRMRFAPEASQELYDAMNAEDWDKAHEIAVKYNFTIREEVKTQRLYPNSEIINFKKWRSF